MKKILLLCVFLCFFSCVTQADKVIKENQSTLNGTWELFETTYSKNLSKDFPEGIPTLTFDASENLSINGYDGCNYIKTKAILKKDNHIEIQKEMISTMMSCEKNKSEDFKKWISESTIYSISETGNVLKLINGEKSVTFHKVVLGGKWVLNQIFTSKSSITKLYPYKKPFINLDIFSTKFTGNTACNMMSGKVTMFQNTIKFEHIVQTEMFCDGLNEKIFSDALLKVTHFKLEGTKLVMFQKDKKILEFIREI